MTFFILKKLKLFWYKWNAFIQCYLSPRTQGTWGAGDVKPLPSWPFKSISPQFSQPRPVSSPHPPTLFSCLGLQGPSLPLCSIFWSGGPALNLAAECPQRALKAFSPNYFHKKRQTVLNTVLYTDDLWPNPSGFVQKWERWVSNVKGQGGGRSDGGDRLRTAGPAPIHLGL
jgi:hypothetical protein